MEKTRIVVLISGGGTNLQAIIDACREGRIDGEVVFVGSDRPGVYGLERAEKHGIPNFVVNYRECETRAAAEAKLLEEIYKHQYDLIVLAGFMKMLTPYFIDKVNFNPYYPRIMNIHPALLPSHPGTDGYGDTWRYGNTVGGCTVHFIDYSEDTGPIIRQRALDIFPGETLKSFKERGLVLEWELYPECIQLFAEGRLKVVDRDIGKGRTKKVVEILQLGCEIHNAPDIGRCD